MRCVHLTSQGGWNENSKWASTTTTTQNDPKIMRNPISPTLGKLFKLTKKRKLVHSVNDKFFCFQIRKEIASERENLIERTRAGISPPASNPPK
jgi:hypothetical protein